MIIVQLLHGPGLDSTSPLWDLEAYVQPILGITVSNQPSDVLEWEKDFCIANLSQYIQHSCCTTWYLWLEFAYKKNTCFWTLLLFGTGRSPPRSCSTTPIFQKLGQIATVDDFVHQDAHASTLSRLVILFDVPLWFSSTFTNLLHHLLHHLHLHLHHLQHVCLRGCWIHAHWPMFWQGWSHDVGQGWRAGQDTLVNICQLEALLLFFFFLFHNFGEFN